MSQPDIGQKQGIVRLTDEEFDAELGEVLTHKLRAIIVARASGHCMRVSDLNGSLIGKVALALKADLGEAAQIHILSAESENGNPLKITSTKLVELRNPFPNGCQRPPLLVFVPSDLKASAEDSFGEATFETLNVRTVYDLLFSKILDLFPSQLRMHIEELLKVPKQRRWPWCDSISQSRFLLTIRKNGYEPDIVGASLYELGLIPDFSLLLEPAEAVNRLGRNLACVGKLTQSSRTERGKVLELGLSKEGDTDKDMIRNLGDYFVESGSSDPKSWAAPIALDRSRWALNFDKWNFADGNDYTVQISVKVTGISVDEIKANDSKDGRLANLQGQMVLIAGSGGQQQFKVTFTTQPHPDKVPVVDHFKLQVVSCATGAPIGLTKKRESWIGGKTERSVSFTKIQSFDWEEGWHFVRILAFTKDNDLIPLVDEEGRIITHEVHNDDIPFVAKLNESEQFYVLKNDDVEVETAESSIPKFESLAHALIDLRFKALTDKQDLPDLKDGSVRWAAVASGTSRKTDLIEVHLGKKGLLNIPVAKFLRELELVILRNPASVCWRVRLESQHIGLPIATAINWPVFAETPVFLEARATFFQKVQGEQGNMVSAGRNFPEMKEEILAYAESYLHLLQAALARAERHPEDVSALEAVQMIISADRIDVEIVSVRKSSQTVSLLGPTHPLRAAWLLAWSLVADEWRSCATSVVAGIQRATRDALLLRIKMMHFPSVLTTATGRMMNCIENLHPFWSFYAPADHRSPKSLLAELCTITGIPEPEGTYANLNAGYLAERIRRYVIQHPYAETLTINCFNVGRAKLLADTLLELQRNSDFESLRYDVRLFVPDPEATGVAEDLQGLLSPTSALAENADVFSLPTGNHLAPKLSFSVRSNLEFETTPSIFPANISLLFDVFPAQEITAEKSVPEEEASPIHGLFQDYTVAYEETEDAVFWKRSPRHAKASPLQGADDLSTVLATLAETMSTAAANVAINQCGLRLRPAFVLHLDTRAKALLHHVHEVSDWVFTVDRNLGIEFFDHGGRRDRPEYLIDHSPDLSVGSGPRLVITSRSLAEVEALFARALNERNLGPASNAAHLLRALRSLSGRLALKLVSSVSQRAEALGLALGQLLLDHLGVFKDQVVVPLDAHLDLYRGFGASGSGQAEGTLQRTDLALFDLNPRERLITCRLVEVKCYQSVGGLAAYAELKNRISAQIAQSEEVLRQHFDPSVFGAQDRPDRKVKCQEFVTLLEFYLDRAHRLGTLSDDVWEEAKYFLRTMEQPYRLSFVRSALVFDFEKGGSEAADIESGIEYHRIGRDIIEELVRVSAANADENELPLGGGEAPSIEASTQEFRELHIRTLETISFRTRARERTVDWECLSTSTFDGVTEDGSAPAEPPDRPLIAYPKADSPEVTPVNLSRLLREDGSGAHSAVETTHSPEPSPSAAPDMHQMCRGPGSADGDAQAIETLTPDILIGDTKESPQFGILGQISGRTLGLDLNQTHTISLFGVQGGGKSYTLGSIIEMATMLIPGINCLPRPLASVVFHYSQTQDYKPEFTSMIEGNNDEASIKTLLDTYRSRPHGLKDVVLLAPKDKIAVRKAEYPDLEVLPLVFSSSELQASHWRFLMGAIGNQAVYIRQLNRIMKGLRNNLTISNLRDAIQGSDLSEAQKSLATTRLGLAEEYIDDQACLKDTIRPGRLIIVDLRDEFIEKDEALGLFVVILQIFSEATWEGSRFNKLVVFDEAHKYIDSPDLVAGLVEVVREMRHKGTSILVASQDPPSVPVSLIELSTQIILHRFNSPGWLKHIQKANSSLSNLTSTQMANLQPGEAIVWSSKATDALISQQGARARLRPRVTLHGGGTKTAV